MVVFKWKGIQADTVASDALYYLMQIARAESQAAVKYENKWGLLARIRKASHLEVFGFTLSPTCPNPEMKHGGNIQINHNEGEPSLSGQSALLSNGFFC